MIKEKYLFLKDHLDEKAKRLWAAAEAKALSYGGVSLVAKATGISRATIQVGLRELNSTVETGKKDKHRIRMPGGGRKSLTSIDPTLLTDLEMLVEPLTRGDPESPLRWTCKSTRKLAKELNNMGHRLGERKVADLLYRLNYSLQANRKTKEGKQHPDRNAQFEYINKQTKDFQRNGDPVISVDAKKKEKVGDFENRGVEWQGKGQPEKVRTYDFIDKELGKVTPYGVFDMERNEGWVSVGIDHDTSEFAIDSIYNWWKKMGSAAYPKAQKLLITADGGGSNSSRSRLWKVGVQDLANRTGLIISVCHFPPGTSKWNKIEHRMFSYITQNWRGRPLISREVVVNLISNTTTKTGLKIKAQLNKKNYPIGIKVTDEELAKIKLRRKKFLGEWNYSISPA